MGFPGGSVVKNLPANAGDTGLIHALRRSHMLGSNQVHVPPLSLCSGAQEPQLLNPRALEPVCSTTREVTIMRSPCNATREQALLAVTRGKKPRAAMKTQCSQK